MFLIVFHYQTVYLSPQVSIARYSASFYPVAIHSRSLTTVRRSLYNRMCEGHHYDTRGSSILFLSRRGLVPRRNLRLGNESEVLAYLRTKISNLEVISPEKLPYRTKSYSITIPTWSFVQLALLLIPLLP